MRFPLFLAAAFLCAAASVAAPPSNALAADAAPIRLQSRTFTPSPGLAALDSIDPEGSMPVHRILQFASVLDPAERAELEAAGVRLLQSIPERSWIVSIAPAASRDAGLRSRLVWAGEILPGDKTPAHWKTDGYGAWAVQPDGGIELRVRFHEDVDEANATADLRALSAEIVESLGLFKGATVRVPERLIPMIPEMDAVLWVSEGLPERVLNNDQNRGITGAEILQASPYDLGGDGIRVGIWDGGLVDQNHDDFAGRLTLGEGGSVNQHATHVAGTFGGTGALSAANGGSPLQWRGMAPEVRIYSWNFNGDVPTEILNGVGNYDLDLETNSWNFGVSGGNCNLYGQYDYWAPEFDAIVTGAGGRLLNVMFSAANERDDGDCPLQEGQYDCIPPPATAKNVITVGATNSDDDTMTSFSSWGPVNDGRLKPDVSAPGCERFGEAHVHSTLPGDTYGGSGWCGTSMAAPTVTGNLALLYEEYAALNGGDRPYPGLMKALLVATAVDLGNPGPDFAFGHGRIDGRKAADALRDDTQILATIENGEVEEINFHVPMGFPKLRFALAWDDPPASPLSDPALVNNLDLVLVDPSNGLHRPWILNPAAPSQNATRGVDSRNNVEHIEVMLPAPGTWKVRMTGTSVPEGPQLAGLVGLDLKSPASPALFDASSPTETTIDLTWMNAPDGDRKATLIVRWEDISLWPGPLVGATYSVGQQVAPGVQVIYVADADHSSIPFTDTGLAAGHTYQYAAYSFDDHHNYSVAATASETTAGSAAVESAVAPLRLRLGPAHPNPAESRVTFAFDLPADGPVEMGVFDAAGRRVRSIHSAVMTAGRHTASWDGLDDAGRPVAPGIYFCELKALGERLSRPVSWTR